MRAQVLAAALLALAPAVARGAPDDQLKGFRDGLRRNPVMLPVVAGLRPAPPASAADPEQAARGRAIAARSRCAGCHGAAFGGQDQVPRLAGQPPRYLARQMPGFREGTRADEDGVMTSLVVFPPGGLFCG